MAIFHKMLIVIYQLRVCFILSELNLPYLHSENLIPHIGLCCFQIPHLTTLRTTLYTSSRGTVVLSGRRNSMAWQAASSSIAITLSTFSITSRRR